MNFTPNIRKIRYKIFILLEVIINSILFVINYIFFLLSNKETKKSVLLTRLDSIGDFVLFTATIPNYRKLYEDYEIVLLVRDIVFDFARNCPYVDQVWKISQGPFRINILYKLKWLKKIRKYKFEKAIQPIYSNSFDFFNILIASSFAKDRIAYMTGKRIKGIYFNRLYDNDFDKKTFEITRNNKMVKYLGYDGILNTDTSIWFDDNNIYKKWKEILNDEYVVLFPGAQVDFRKFDKNKYLEIINEIKEFKWVICGSKNEKYLGHFFKKNSNTKIIDLTGKTSLLELAYIIKNARYVLSNETVAVHISAAMGTKTFCVMGGGHYGRFYPYPNNENTIAITHKMDCFNCDWKCIFPEKKCITKITTKEVIKNIKNILNKGVLN